MQCSAIQFGNKQWLHNQWFRLHTEFHICERSKASQGSIITYLQFCLQIDTNGTVLIPFPFAGSWAERQHAMRLSATTRAEHCQSQRICAVMKHSYVLWMHLSFVLVISHEQGRQIENSPGLRIRGSKYQSSNSNSQELELTDLLGLVLGCIEAKICK